VTHEGFTTFPDVSVDLRGVVVDVPGSPRRGLVSWTMEGVVLQYQGITRSLYEGSTDDVRPVGDVNGDGHTDLLVQLSSARSVLLLLQAEGARAIDLPGCSMGLGDWDCDGFDDLASDPDVADGLCGVRGISGWQPSRELATEWLAGGPDGPSMPAALPAGGARALTHPDLDLDGCRDEPSNWPSLYPTTTTIARGRVRAPSSETWPLGLPPIAGDPPERGLSSSPSFWTP